MSINFFVGACSDDGDDNAAFCALLDENLKPFEVGGKVDLDAVRELVDAAPDDLRDGFADYLGLAEQINQLDLTDQEGSAEMRRLVAQANGFTVDKVVVDFRLSECGAVVSVVSDRSANPN